MLQRKQTLWLLLSVLCATLSFRFPFATGKQLVKGALTDSSLNGSSSFVLLILTGASVIIAGIAIIFFKDRKLQLRLCLGGIALSILILVIYVMQFNKLVKPTLALSSIFTVLIIAAFVMAFRDIRRDEKLVKSLDKLR